MNTAFNWPQNIPAPVAGKNHKEFLQHGDRRQDEYYWLNERDSAAVLDYLNAENAYVDTMMAGTKQFQENLFLEIKNRIRERDESVPYKENGYWYYLRYEESKQYAIICRKKESLEAPEEILADQNKMAEGLKYFDMATAHISDNNELMAITTDTVSRRLYHLRFKNLLTGTFYPEVITEVDGHSVAWAADNRTIFYVKKDPVTLLEFQVWRHVLGTDPSNDVLLYEEKDNRYSLSLERTRSKKYIVLEAEMNEVSNEYRLLEAAQPESHFRVFHPREENLQYKIQHVNDQFYVLTDWKAPNFRLMQTPETATTKEHWKEKIPTRKDVYISDFLTFNNHLVLNEVKEASEQLRVIPQNGQPDYYIQFDEPGYTTSFDVNPDFHTPKLRFSYTSLTTPTSIFDFDMDTKERVLKKQEAVLGGFNKEDYVAEKHWATARDGVKVPISLVYKKGLMKNGNNPLLLYGYGSYGISMFPHFNLATLSLLNRGFIFAIAHIRGGQEMGRQWYDDGHLFKKKNTFFDFIDCGEYLIREKFTASQHLYAQGGSAGGLLMGAVVNLRPDLFHGVIAQVPFVDVITTMSDPDIPLTTGEYKEWGNPADSTEYFYMKSYSPYDNVTKQAYPHMLVTTGLHDSQVQYFEPAKWVARLRTLKTGNNLLLFKTNMDAGHGGASGRFDYIREEALQYAFLLALENITE